MRVRDNKEPVKYLTSQIHIKQSNINYKVIQQLCRTAKSFYNICLYDRRQFEANKFKSKTDDYFMSEYEYSKHLSSHELYRTLPNHTSQLIISQVYNDWKSFFKAIKTYSSNPGLFKGRPKPPNYKRAYSTVYMDYLQVKIKGDCIHFPKKTYIKPIKIPPCIPSIKQVRIIPSGTCFIVEIVYPVECVELKPFNGNFLAIDLGLNNIITTIDNASGSFIIKGGIVKSINQYYNKRLATLKSIAKQAQDKRSTKQILNLTTKRNNRIKDFMHKVSKATIDHCLKYNITKIIVGHNIGQKQDTNLSKKTNQNFVFIPHYKLIQMIKYKARLQGITVIITEESYTSKIDHLSGEPMKHQKRYLGSRKHRGLFISDTGIALNADVNGAIGIARKVIDKSVSQIVDRGVVLTPVKKKVI